MRWIAIAVLACACNPGDSPAIDGGGDGDAVLPGETFVARMSVTPDEPRALVAGPLRFGNVTITEGPVHGTLTAVEGGARFVYHRTDDTPLPYVERVRGVVTNEPSSTVTMVLAIGGSIWVASGGQVTADGFDRTQPEPTPWVIVGDRVFNTPYFAREGDEHEGGVFVESGAVIVVELTVRGGGFIALGDVQFAQPEWRRPRIIVDTGPVGGDIPELETHHDVYLRSGVTTQRITVGPDSVLTIDGGHTADTGIGESFVAAGGTLRLVDGVLVNGRIVEVGGTVVTSHAAARLHLTRMDVTGVLDLARGQLDATTDLIINPPGLATIGAGATATADNVYVRGTLRVHGTLTVAGRLDLDAAATFESTGTVTFGQCFSGGVQGAPPCPP